MCWPAGHSAKRIAPPAPDLKEVPDWAKEDLQNLSDGGILADSDLTGTSDGEEEEGAAGSSILEEPVAMKDAIIISARFYAAFGTDLKDDFYTAVNQKQLNAIEIPEGEEMAEQLLAVGESQEKAEAHADGILKLEKDLVDHMQNQDASGKIKEPKYYTPETLDEMMPQAKLSQLVQSIGFTVQINPGPSAYRVPAWGWQL